MNDKQLRHLISELPEEKASPGFTQRVLKRLAEDEHKPEKRSYKLIYLSAGLILIAVIGLTIGFKTRPVTSQKQLREEISQLRKEHRLLTETLTRLRTRLEKNHPTVYLGGDEHVDYVLDTTNLHRAQSASFEGFR